jgi:hypothetical protein
MCTPTPATGTPASASDDLSLYEALDFIDDKLTRLLSRCRLLNSLADPYGLENVHSRVVEIDRTNLSNLFDELAEDIEITRHVAAELRAAVPPELGRTK